MTPRLLFRTLAVSAILSMPVASTQAAPCGTGSFGAWLDDFKNEAAAKGISQAAIASGLAGVTLDQAVLSRDHSQRVFSQSFEEFSGRMVPPRLARGANMMKQYGSVLGRIEQSYGVPGEVLVAIWGLETDYGVNIGKFPTIRSLARPPSRISTSLGMESCSPGATSSALPSSESDRLTSRSE